MERTNFGRIVTAALVFAAMGSASSVWAEECLVDLEEETADLDQSYALYVGRDEAGIVICLGLFEFASDDASSPQVVAWAAPEGPCTTADGELDAETSEGFTEIAVLVAGRNVVGLSAPTGQRCGDSDGISLDSYEESTTLYAYSTVESIDESLPVEIYGIDDGSRMSLQLQRRSSERSGESIDAVWRCDLDEGESVVQYGVCVSDGEPYTDYICVCETNDDSLLCVHSAPQDADDAEDIHAYSGGGMWAFSPTSRVLCNEDYSVHIDPWLYAFRGSSEPPPVVDRGDDVATPTSRLGIDA